jgi:hypothetical protein
MLMAPASRHLNLPMTCSRQVRPNHDRHALFAHNPLTRSPADVEASIACSPGGLADRGMRSADASTHPCHHELAITRVSNSSQEQLPRRHLADSRSSNR